MIRTRKQDIFCKKIMKKVKVEVSTFKKQSRPGTRPASGPKNEEITGCDHSLECGVQSENGEVDMSKCLMK